MVAQQYNEVSFWRWWRVEFWVFDRYQWETNPFRAVDILTHIANCLRPLNGVDSVWLEDLSKRFPAEWEQVSTQVRLQGGPSLDPAPIPRIEWVLKLGLGWSGRVQVQRIVWGWLAWKRVQHLHLQEAGARSQAQAWLSLGLHTAQKWVQHLRLQDRGGSSQAQAGQSLGFHTIKTKNVSWQLKVVRHYQLPPQWPGDYHWQCTQ